MGTGGTIAGTSAVAGANTGYIAAQISVEDLVKAVPALAEAAPGGLVCEQIAQIDSKDMAHSIWLKLARHCEKHLADPDVQGVVITHGTDTLEETAWFLQQVLNPAKPVVLCSAMRPATALVPDGPQNLLDSVIVAGEPTASGVLCVAAGEIHGAREVSKQHPLRLNAFSSGDIGPLGWVEGARVRWTRDVPPEPPVASSSARLVEALPEPDLWPQVEIVMSHAGVSGAFVRVLTAQGVDGIVVAATGNGTVHEALEKALEAAEQEGVLVRVASRCAEGQLLGEPDARWASANGLSPVKARISLMLDLIDDDLASGEEGEVGVD
ncbi:asparaginase [Diaphorobacter aerolatus]|uniref:Asparaginase n=1 Tax=Diaphorobacter aerolatus TaxID=1288495 RepID=A0A7H0GPX2_9BURK|nr:asparaginase [Diaphorobacter aerolatus]